jgi:hypothetical protein
MIEVKWLNTKSRLKNWSTVMFHSQSGAHIKVFNIFFDNFNNSEWMQLNKVSVKAICGKFIPRMWQFNTSVYFPQKLLEQNKKNCFG